MRLSTIIKLIAALAFTSTVVVWVGALVFGVFAMQAEMLFTTCLITAGLAIAALPCAICVERGRLRRTMQTGVVMAAISAIGWGAYFAMQSTLSVVVIDRGQDVLAATSAGAVVCSVLAIVVMYRTTNPIVRGLRCSTIAAALTLAAVVLSVVWFERAMWADADLAAKIISTLVAVVGFGMIATVLVTRLWQLESDGDLGEDLDEVVRLDLTVVCPRCGLRQPLQTGGATCRRCGLQIRIIVP